MEIYVGNLAQEATPEELQALFEAYGRVNRTHIVLDKNMGLPRGFAFVYMPDEEEAQAALTELAGVELQGKRLRLMPAYPQKNQ